MALGAVIAERPCLGPPLLWPTMLKGHHHTRGICRVQELKRGTNDGGLAIEIVRTTRGMAERVVEEGGPRWIRAGGD